MANNGQCHESPMLKKVDNAIKSNRSLYISFRVPTFDLPAYLQLQAEVWDRLGRARGDGRVICLSPTNIEADIAMETFRDYYKVQHQKITDDETEEQNDWERRDDIVRRDFPHWPDDNQISFMTYYDFTRLALFWDKVNHNDLPDSLSDVDAIFLYESLSPDIYFELSLGIIAHVYAAIKKPLILVVTWRFQNQLAQLDSWFGKGFRAVHRVEPTLRPPEHAQIIYMPFHGPSLASTAMEVLNQGRNVVSFGPRVFHNLIDQGTAWLRRRSRRPEQHRDVTIYVNSLSDWSPVQHALQDAPGPMIIHVESAAFSRPLPFENVGLVILSNHDHGPYPYYAPKKDEYENIGIPSTVYRPLNRYHLAIQYEYVRNADINCLSLSDPEDTFPDIVRSQCMDDSAITWSWIYDTSDDDIMLLTFYSIAFRPGRIMSSLPLRYMNKHHADIHAASKRLERLGLVRPLADSYILTDVIGRRLLQVLSVFREWSSFYSLVLLARAGPEEPERIRRLLVRVACLWIQMDLVTPPSTVDTTTFATNFSSWPCEEGLFKLMSHGKLWLLLGCWDKVRQDSENFGDTYRQGPSWASVTLDGGLTIDTQRAYFVWYQVCRCEEVLGIPHQDPGKDETTEDEVKEVINHLMWVFADSHQLVSIPLNTGVRGAKTLDSGHRVALGVLDENKFTGFMKMHAEEALSRQDFPAADTMIALALMRRAADGVNHIAMDCELTVLGYSQGLTGWHNQQTQ